MGPGLDHELTQLRARAYGPDADIHTDPPALARLRELERQASEARRSEDGPAEPSSRETASTERMGGGGFTTAFGEPFAEPTAVVTPPRRRSSERAGSAVHPQPAGSAPEVPRASDVSRPPPIAPASLVAEPPPKVLGRRVRMAWAASLAIAVIVAAGLTVWLLPFGVRDDQHHDARLVPQNAEIPRSITPQLVSIGNGSIPDDVRVRYFGDYYGLGIYATADCLQAVAGRSQQTVFATCGNGLDPVMDVYMPSLTEQEQLGNPSYPEELRRRFPDGGVVRFTFRGDEILVDEGHRPVDQ